MTTPAQGQTAVIWENRDCLPRRFGFSGSPGIKVASLGYFSSPLDVFLQFFPEHLFDYIADQTNKYADDHQSVNLDSHRKDWFSTTSDEIKALVSLVILMGIMPKPDVQAYWSREPTIETPFFGNTMSRDRFLQLQANMRFNNNNDDDGTDRLFKLRPVIKTLTKNFKRVYIPSQDVTTCESHLKIHDREKRKQHSPDKRAHFSIRIFKTCQSTGDAVGYTWNMKISTGKDHGAVMPRSARAVLDLNKDLLDRGYNIFLDSKSSSPALFLRLRDRQTNACGTVRLHQRQMPSDLKKVKLKRGECAFRSSDCGLLALIWKDKKEVKMLSTIHSAAMQETGKSDRHGKQILKPSCILDHSRCRGAVELSDQLASSHHSMWRSVKWYRKLFFYMVDLCLVNSFLVSRLLGRETTYLDFRMALVKEILHTVTLPVYNKRGRPHALPAPNRLTGWHFPITLPPTEKTPNPCRRCVVCKSEGRRRETRYACDTCNVPLCVHPCFKTYHTERDY
ncbi:piggyBac transposable element-derived protein 4-like [Acanthaster planci]|uniref:PiggyBac transposable element-derived protein 4-like n=1 Tax=Acanthaster planci TaxID=133434 RepID=A0A8B7Z285_ACAPL|nr:piggyBac transposable element-derived protein 4-like [Acanthaster planci]